ncbi:Papain family cysteine protease [Planctomycetes bacterium Poly30]|uniref:Papain family cysteine protease n=1 Tax=Saltatorellus ferox TaxID=2528018 RepID=A0A518F0L4_9BACT|nr:Papain family cysteine protease [Planctomycetes bacterium Poly30]
MVLSPRLTFLFPALLTLLTGARAVALPQGATREDRASVAGLEAFTAGAQLDELPRSVDLRPLLPAVGRQTMNDCAAWAFGYAGRTYLEALDQGWKPDSPERIFSPTFIYNQVNQGVDGGSRVDRVLDLLLKQGAATLATAPYLAKDFTTPPPAEAAAEAEVFRIASFGLLPAGPDIRAALAEGHIVMCCVRTNPVFSSGRYPVYTAADHERGRAARRADQPHGFHAMAIVGYSDDREAFLFMNSWGQDWGDRGFVWVGYDAAQTFNQNGATEELVDFAVVMIDRREPVARSEKGYEVLDFQELQAVCTGAFSGYDPAAEAGAYRYTVSLRGPAALMANLASVEWTVPGPDGDRTVSTESADSGFRVSGRSHTPTIHVEGTARMKAGHAATVRVDVKLQETARRSLALDRVDSFHDSTAGGDLWRWTLLPRMSDADWRDLVRIEWSVDAGSNLKAPATYVHDGGLPPAWTMASTVMPSFRSPKPAAGSAYLSFRDGSRHELAFPTSAFTDPVRKELLEEVVWRPVGVDGDRSWYFYELRIRYPEAWADNLLGISVETGNQTDWISREAAAVDGPGPRMHVLHGFAKRPFSTYGRASFRTRHPRLGSTTPVMNSRIIDFGDDVAWEIPTLAKPEVLVKGRGYGIESRDRYVGEVDGKPVWAFEVYVDGTANMMAIEELTWTIGDKVTAFSRENESPLDGYVLEHRSSQPFDAVADCTLWDGQTFQLRRTVQPFAPRNSALALDLTDVTPAELQERAPDRVLGEVQLAGQEADLATVREIVGYSRRAWGGVLPTQVALIDYNLLPEGTLGKIEVPRDLETTFVLHADDGSAIALEVKPHALSPAPAMPRFQLLARERFAGFGPEGPTWNVELDVRGEEAFLDQLESIDWSAVAVEDHAPCGAPVAEAALRRATLTVDRPVRVRARLHFAAGNDLEPLEVSAPVLTFSRRARGDLRVVVDRGWIWDPIERYGPGVNPASIHWPSTPYRMRIEGAPSLLAEVASVRWLARDAWQERSARKKGEPLPEPVAHASPGETRALGFEWRTEQNPDQNSRNVTPELVMHDGSTRQFATFELVDGMEAVDRRQPVPVAQMRDWGIVDGQRRSLLIAGVPDPDWATRLLRATFSASVPLVPFGGLPEAALERPIARRAFLVDRPGQIDGLQLRHRQKDAGGFDESTETLRTPATFALAAPIEEPSVRLVESPEDGGTFWYLSVAAPESLLARTRSVRWTLSWGAATSEYVVDRIGERSDAFELRIAGERPSTIEGVLLDPSGATIGTARAMSSPAPPNR